MSNILLLSYPRSGNSLVKYFIKRSIGLKDVNDCKFQTAARKNKHISPSDFKENFFFKEHFAKYCNQFDSNNDKLILVIRNYKECLPRHSPGAIGPNKHTKQEIKEYCNNILFFHKWLGPKKHIYYEDLITDFEKTYCSLLPVLGNVVDEIKHKELFNELNYHKEQCLKQYSKVCGSYTRGKYVLFHSKKLDTNVKKFMDDQIIINLNEKLFKLYLQRYK